MRRTTPYSICYWLSCAGIGLFIGNTIKDAINYIQVLNSAPFYVFVLENAVTYLLPGAVFAGLAYFFKKRQKNKVSVPESEKSREELLKEFSEYDRNKEEYYETTYHLGGTIPSILEKYGFSDYIKDLDASYNGGSFDLEYYRNYMTKNTIRFSGGTLYKDGLDDYAARALVLIPKNYPVKNFSRIVKRDFVFDDRAFWRM